MTEVPASQGLEGRGTPAVNLSLPPPPRSPGIRRRGLQDLGGLREKVLRRGDCKAQGFSGDIEQGMGPTLKSPSGGINQKRHLGPHFPSEASEPICLWLLPSTQLWGAVTTMPPHSPPLTADSDLPSQLAPLLTHPELRWKCRPACPLPPPPGHHCPTPNAGEGANGVDP